MSKKDEALKLAEDALKRVRTQDMELVQLSMIALAAIREALAEQPSQRKYCRGDRLICLETEEYCVIHISGTDRQWVKFPDTHIGVYKNEQLAELFELLPKEIEIEQPAQRTWVGLTDEEVWDLWNSHTEEPFPEWFVDFKRAYKVLEAKLKEKNT